MIVKSLPNDISKVPDKLEMLLDKDVCGLRAMHEAVSEGNAEVVKLLAGPKGTLEFLHQTASPQR